MTQIDHVFVFPENLAEIRQRLDIVGLTPSFRRRHPGQGTANLCYCFENLYLELLWVEDVSAAENPQVARTALIQRGSAGTSACPIGIAWRDDGQATPDFETWDYEAPFLPAGKSIAVATESDDPEVPFIFRSPGSQAPMEWTDGRAGNLQRAAGLGPVERIMLGCPPHYEPGQTMMKLTERSILSIESAARWMITLEVSRQSTAGPLHVTDIW
jgi:hypothetical protein